MPSRRQTQVNKAIEDILVFHKRGKEIGKKPRAYGDEVIDAEARNSGISPDTLRKARVFADPEIGYAIDELQELKNLIKEKQSGQEDTEPVFRRTHVIRLLSVKPKTLRKKLQRQAIENAWSLRRLNEEIGKQCGTRRAGGRRRRIPGDKTALLVQMEKMCEEWKRWRAALDRLAKEGAGEAAFDELPRPMRQQIKNTTKFLDDLHEIVNKELAKTHPDREMRPAFRTEESRNTR